MRIKKFTALLCAAMLLVPAALTSCGSGESSALQVVVCAPYVDEEALAAYSDAMYAEHPEWAEGESAVEFVAFSGGSADTDPSAFAASMMKISAMVASNEVDLMICDYDNAQRNARGEMYTPLADIFSEEELAAYEGRTMSFEAVDENSEPTGEMLPECGISIDGNKLLDAVYGDTQYGVYYVSNTQNPDLAKEVMLQIADS